jgi:hypothetical protein
VGHHDGRGTTAAAMVHHVFTACAVFCAWFNVRYVNWDQSQFLPLVAGSFPHDRGRYYVCTVEHAV